MYCELDQITVSPDAPLREAVACLDRGRRGIVLVNDPHGRLVDVLVDGDLRRALLAGHDFNVLVGQIMQLKRNWWPHPPVTAPVGASHPQLIELMRSQAVRQVPLVDEEGRVVDLVTMADLMPAEPAPPLQAVIMAGGFGKRLRPFTASCPKPLLPLGEKPLLSHTIGRLERAGIKRVSLSTHYRCEQIRQTLGDGQELGVELRYLEEETPLGTAGALGLMPPPEGTVLVINGDILTQLDIAAMHVFHREHQATLTLAVRKYEMEVPFGVIETEGAAVCRITEKPTYNIFVNAGIYLVEPEAQAQVEAGERLDMTELIQRLISRGFRVVSFPVVEYWLDVGTPESYQRAQEDYYNGRLGE